MFLGREAELEYLNRQYEKKGSQMLVVYGQRNAGRTALIRQFGKDKELLFLYARSCSGREQRYLWAGECEACRMSMEKYPSYFELLWQLSKSAGKKLVLVIDGFENAVKNDPAFMKELADFLKDQGSVQELLILLSSSSVGFVENAMVSRIGEAALSISGFLKVKELKFEALQEYFAGYSLKQCLETYAVLGGLPGLWKHFSRELSPEENMIKKVLDKEGFFINEVFHYVNDELRETGVYHTILASLASGRQKLNDLHLHTEFGRAKISVYLKNLMELELVEKIFSYDTDGKANTQKGVYRIGNPLVYFYFRYIYSSLSAFQSLSSQEFYERYVKPECLFLTEPAMRRMCLERLQTQNEGGELPFCFTRFGEWVGKIGTIDIVAQDEAGHTLLVLCNCEKPLLTMDDYEWLMFLAKKARLMPQYIILYTLGEFDQAIQRLGQENGKVCLVTLGKDRFKIENNPV